MNSQGSLLFLALLAIFVEKSLSAKPIVKPLGYNSNRKNFYKPITKNGNNTVGYIFARILEIGGDGNTEGDVHVSEILPNSDVIVGVDTSNSTKLILECSAPFPVQWSYFGDGMPEFSSNTSVIWEKKTKVPREFIATIALGFERNLEGRDTGNYICKNTKNPQISVYYYLFVPGKSLFISKGGVIPFSIYDTIVRIPCSVTTPYALVTLQKSVNGLLQCPINDSITYNIKSGFHMHVTEDDETIEPGGHYVCTAGYNNSFQMIEFTLEQNQPGALSDEIVDVPGVEEASNLARGDYSCDICGPNSNCRSVAGHNFPHCTCKQGYLGRPPKCRLQQDSLCQPNPCGSNSVCQENPGRNYPRCSCLPGFIGRAPHCRPECNLNSDCPPSMLCQNQKCVDPCLGANKCGENAECNVNDHVIVCSCPPGYQGNPMLKCGRDRMPSVQYFPTITVFDHKMRHPCEPWPCGPLSECKPVDDKAHCTCAPGYVGQPPNCSPECRQDSECSSSLACIENKCRDPCVFAQVDCTPNGKCLTNNHEPECYCPSFRGTSLVPCTQQDQQVSQSTTRRPPPPPPSQSTVMFPVHHNPIIGVSEDQINYPRPGQSNKNPCSNPSPCGVNARCTYKNQTIGCKCQAGCTAPGSDPFTECKSSNIPCEICGPNSICQQHPDGQSTCMCKPGAIGYPPYCRDNYCVINEDCPTDKACKGGNCVDPCQASRCAESSECRIIRHMAVCACPNSPELDPFWSCKVKTGKVPFGIE